MALHQAGRLQEAVSLYNKVLAEDSRHFEALHLLGMASIQTGQPAAAVDLLERAIRVNPNVAATHSLLAAAFHPLGRRAEALASYDRAVALQPDPEAFFNRGVVLAELGRPGEAVASYQRAISLKPRYPEACYNLGVALRACGRPEEALASFDRVIELDGGLPFPHNNRGQTLAELGRFAEAVASYDRAIALNPGDADLHHNRAIALERQGAPADALASYERAIAMRPGQAVFHDGRGSALFTLGRHGEALASYERAMALTPALARAHNGRGIVLTRLGRPGAALESFDTAVGLAPDDAELHNNRAVALRDLDRHDEALAAFDRAVALDPAFSEAVLNRADLLLLLGRFDLGWREYERRRSRWTSAQRALGEERRWLGDADLAGKRLFVHHEQGLGDTIQFCRYLRMAQDQGAQTILSAQRPLRPLLRQLGVPILDEGEPPPDFDFQCSLLSLPLAFRTTLETIPAATPYLFADEERRRRFVAKLGARGKPRVGLAWSGNPTHKNDHNRSVAFARLAPLLSPTFDWVCLQDEIRPEDAQAFAAGGKVAFHGDALRDFADTAGLIDLMDLVITVDTSIAHLAGAMGKPVWILLPFKPDWRWMLGRTDTPWYPSARLFRQPAIGDWESVIGALASELAAAGEPI
jgi:tetratricopeptide (TPR) repeat protein